MTIEEIKTAVAAQPELKTAIISSFKPEFELSVTAEGKIIRTKEEDQSHLDNHVKAVVDAKVSSEVQQRVDPEFFKMMSKIDTLVKDITGVEKNASEKTTDYAKRALSDKHKAADSITVGKVTELENMLASTKEEYENKLKEANNTLFSKDVEYEVLGALDKASVALPAHLKTDEDKMAYANQQKALIKNGFLGSVTPKKDNEGNIVFYKGDKPLMNTKDGKPKNASDIIHEEYANWFVPQGQPGTGTGARPQGGTGAFKTKDDIHKHLASQGVEAGSQKYSQEFEKIATEASIPI